MPFLKCLDLSTGHVTNSDRLKLDEGDGIRSDTDAIRYQAAGEYGWVVWPRHLEDDELEAWRREMREDGWSEYFIAICELAGQQGDCMVINFDRDADEHEDLPTFDWSSGDGNTPIEVPDEA